MNIIKANDNHLRTFGYEAVEVIGKITGRFISEEYRPKRGV